MNADLMPEPPADDTETEHPLVTLAEEMNADLRAEADAMTWRVDEEAP